MPWLPEWSAFVRTADSGSMAAASRQMDCSRAQISKLLADLERALGVRLLERTTRSQKLTPSGEVFYQQALRVLAELDATELALQSVTAIPRGVVRISAPVAFGRMHVAPLLSDVATRYPELACELVLSDQLVDVAEEGFDLAIRLTDHPPEELVAKKLADIRRVICASPAYLERCGRPVTPKDLPRHHCFAYIQARTVSEWRLSGPRGIEVVPVRGKFQVNHIETVMAAALRGDGIAILPDYLCSRELERGDLVHVMPDYEPMTSFGRRAYACYPGNRARLAKFRVVLSALQEHFTPAAPWESSARRIRA